MPSKPSKLQELVRRSAEIRDRMWTTRLEEQPLSVALFYTFLRVVAITWRGLKENRLVIRAAALTFSSMLGLFPMIAIMVLVSGFVLQKTNPELAIDTINRIFYFIAPQVENYEEIETEGATEVDTGIRSLTEQFIERSQSGAVGIGGTVMLMLIVLQLFSSIEDAFNEIWGVSKGRALVTRIGIYWTVITLGAVLTFAGLAILGVQIAQYADYVSDESAASAWGSTAVSVAVASLLTLLLTLFYRFIPNTYVTWRAGLIGAACTVCGLYINKNLAFLYVERVTLQKSLYGSLGILTVLPLGLFIFWIIILLGGRITYAVQNAHFRSDKMAWDALSQHSKEMVSLVLFTRIARCFKQCEPPLSAEELSQYLNLPLHFINASLNKLCEMSLASAIPPEGDEHYKAYKYQPARPLNRIRLLDFKRQFATFGVNPEEDFFEHAEPLVQRYKRSIASAESESFGDKTFEDLLEEEDKPASPAEDAPEPSFEKQA